MSATLDPRTQKKIRAFATRRRELILLRGICSLVGGVLLAMTALAILDSLIILPDRARWALSVFGYGAVATLVWQLSLRHLIGRPGPTEIARLLERAEPSMREDLISAIELGDAESVRENYDSERFRELVQADVGERASRIDVPQLLPLSMVSKWLKGALAAVLLVVVLALVPGLNFGKMFARALLPGVDLARPSKLRIEFIEPDPADRIVPANEAVVVKVSITGGDVERAELEAREQGGKVEKIRLTRERDNRFSGSLTVKRHDVEYRVRSAGAITRFHTLESRGRPLVEEFSKTYSQPSYTGVAAWTDVEDHGDLSAIEGTTVRLSLLPDQAIAEAELRLRGGVPELEDMTIPLEVDGDGRLVAQVPITTDYSLYRVHLVADESGFSNEHSPDYEIRAVADLTPELQITQPANNLEIRSDATLELKGIARDDVSLEVVKQAYRLNRSDWREMVLHTDCGTEQLIDHRWSLRGIGAKPGDLLVLKLVGIDSKGSVGESTPVRLAVTGWDEDPSRREWAEREKAVAEELRKVAKETREMAHEVERAKEALKKQPEDRSLEEQQAVARAQNEAEQAQAEAEQAFEKLKQALLEAPSRAEAEELQAAAEMLADFKNQNLEQVPELVGEMAAGERREPEDGNRRPQHLAWEAAKRAEVLERAIERLAAEDNAAIAADDLSHLEERQEEIAQDAHELAGDSEAEAGLLREEQEVAAARAESIGQDLRELGEMLDGGEKNLAENAAKKLDEQRRQLEAALSEEEFSEKLPGEAQKMEKRLEDVERNAQQLEQQTARLAEQAREELFRKQPPASESVEEAKRQAEQVARDAEQVARQQADANANPEQLAEGEERLAERGEQLARQLESLAEQFEDLADLEDASPVGESQQAADLDQVARALDDLANRAEDADGGEDSQQVAQDLAKLQEAIEAIEAGENAGDLAAALAELEQAERAPEPEAGEQNADAWDVAEQQLKALPQDLQRVENSEEAQQQAQQAANSQESRTLENEMNQREQAAARNDENRKAEAMAEPLGELQDQVEKVAEKIEPAVERAREDVAALAPSVPEMLRDLAEQVGEQQIATEELAELAQAVEPGDAGEVAEQVAERMAENEQASERLEEAMDALRHEANAEDLLTEEGRGRARDADDAAAQLAQAEAQKVAEQLEQAATSTSPQQQAQALEAAADDQGKLAERLNDLAEQLEGLDQDEAIAAEAREALREMEQSLGVEEALDLAFDRAENVAEMLAAAEQDPATALEALERELQQNQAMQDALQDLTQETLAEAAAQMADAASEESRLGDQLSESGQEPQAELSQQAMSQAAQQQGAINDAVTEAGEAVERAARHEQRLGNEAAAESLAELGEAAKAIAQQGEAAEALEAMQGANKSPTQAAQSAQAAEAAIAAQAEAMRASQPEASPQDQQAPNQSQGASESPSPGEAARAQSMAQALDSLDQMFAAQEASSPRTPLAQAQQAAAQQALAEAAQAQSQAMAQARAQGQMTSPQGQSSQAQAQAQRPGQAAQSQQGAQLTASAGSPLTGAAASTFSAGSSEVGEDWSKLPSKVAKDIVEAQRQGVSPEYRSAIESYYKAIADRARRKQNP